MIKKTLMVSSMVLALLLSATPALAQRATRRTGADNPVKIACVGAAVSVRETSIGAAITVHSQAVGAVYTARATALAAAYTQTTTAGVKTAVKAAWSTFGKSVKSANMAWRASRNAAWSKFKTAVKACNASTVIVDISNSGSEVE